MLLLSEFCDGDVVFENNSFADFGHFERPVGGLEVFFGQHVARFLVLYFEPVLDFDFVRGRL